WQADKATLSEIEPPASLDSRTEAQDWRTLMAAQRRLAALTGVNFPLLIGLPAGNRRTGAQSVPSGLRGRALEIVGQQGRARASLVVQPADQGVTMPGGGTLPETVILRLVDPYG